MKKKSIIVIILIIVLAVFAYGIYYVNDYYHADDTANQYLNGTGNVTVIKQDEGLLLDGPGNDTALIFYPGAKIEYTSYLPMITHLSERGVDCYLVEMPFNLAFLGKDLAGDTDLLSLLQELQEGPGEYRIRLGSLEPSFLTKETVSALAAMPRLCPHFHLSLQSGCDATLQRMGRRYTTEEYAEKVRMLREAFEDPALTTDLIAGFPGETEEEFAATCAFVERMA